MIVWSCFDFKLYFSSLFYLFILSSILSSICLNAISVFVCNLHSYNYSAVFTNRKWIDEHFQLKILKRFLILNCCICYNYLVVYFYFISDIDRFSIWRLKDWKANELNVFFWYKHNSISVSRTIVPVLPCQRPLSVSFKGKVISYYNFLLLFFLSREGLRKTIYYLNTVSFVKGYSWIQFLSFNKVRFEGFA